MTCDDSFTIQQNNLVGILISNKRTGKLCVYFWIISSFYIGITRNRKMERVQNLTQKKIGKLKITRKEKRPNPKSV